MATIRPYDIIFLDWYITLSHSHYWEQLREKSEEHFRAVSDWLIGNMPVFNEWMRGRLETKDIAMRVAAEIGLEGNYVYSELMNSFAYLAYDFPEVAGEIARLRASGVRVVLATDNVVEFSTITVEKQGLHNQFDAILNSAELGVLKGDGVADGIIPFFDEFITRHDSSYDRVVLIDDSPTFITRHPNTQLRQIQVDDAAHTLEVLKAITG